MVSDPYEPLDHSSLWALPFKINPCCLLLWGDCSGATLRSNPSFVPGIVQDALPVLALPVGYMRHDPASVVRAHSTRGVAASTALFSGVCVKNVCTAESCTEPETLCQPVGDRTEGYVIETLVL